MTIYIAYFLYIFGDNGANMLYSRAVNKMCSRLPNVFTVILGVGGVFVPLTQKSKLLNNPHLNLATSISISMVYI